MERRECGAPRSAIKHLIKDSLKKHCGGFNGCPKSVMFKIWSNSKRINLEKHDAAIKEAIDELKQQNILTEDKGCFKIKVNREAEGLPKDLTGGQAGSSKMIQKKVKSKIGNVNKETKGLPKDVTGGQTGSSKMIEKKVKSKIGNVSKVMKGRPMESAEGQPGCSKTNQKKNNPQIGKKPKPRRKKPSDK